MNEKIICLGKEFNSEDERREYFRNELRKMLPELKKIEGFPIGEDNNIINLSDPPYYTACPNPWLNEFVKEWEIEKKDLEKKEKRTPLHQVLEPYATDVSEGKNNAIYNAHSYHTKVPHPAIMRYIMHYTQPGDIVLDGFAGTGMTGVAASYCAHPTNEQKYLFERMFDNPNWGKRHAINIDLSPVAGFISYNINNVFHNPDSFREKLDLVNKKYSWMFETNHSKTQKGHIKYVVWNEIILCDHCDSENEFMELFIKMGDGEILNESKCKNCNSKIERSKVKRKVITKIDPVTNEPSRELDVIPYRICYDFGGKRHFKKPDEDDYEVLKKIDRIRITTSVPLDALPDGDKMSDPINKFIDKVYKLYHFRTLIILSELWAVANLNEKFYLTNSISRNLTKLNRFIVNKHNPNGRINGPLSGTLYVPSEVVEQNPFEIINYKLYNSVEKLSTQLISCESATDISLLPNNSIDYIFVDPPFGANIMYSELNFITESWLSVKTNNIEEAIENKTQNKGKLEYQNLMFRSFQSFFRILKPGKWMTVEFSNTSAAIWNCIQTSISNSGFVIANISALDKVHGGIKSMRYDTSVKQDLIITCYKPSDEFMLSFNNKEKKSILVWDFISEHLNHLPVHIEKQNKTTAIIERNPKILYDRLIAFYVQRNLPVPIDATKFQEGLRDYFIERDGMFFTNEQIYIYDLKKKENPEFIQLSILVSSEQDGVLWLKNLLSDKSSSYQDIQPLWMQALAGVRKGDIIPELADILEDNFLKDSNGKWYVANPENEADLEKLRNKRLLKQFENYKEEAAKPKGKIKEARVEALRVGFKQCYQEKDFKTIVQIGDRIPNNLLMEDEVLLQFYDIAISRV
jgi:DNA modification methylase